MEESFTIPAEDNGDSELDPRIQVELEKLNAATDEINKLETELDESNTTFRLLLGEGCRRLQELARRLGGCVDKSRPYYAAVEAAADARARTQRAALHYQRASELHAAAKETVTLAEQRFVSKQHEWQFDSAWQEVLNHAILKVMDAEAKKAESGRDHHQKAVAFHAAERKVAQLEESLKRHIIKSRLYFEEKKLCEEQLKTQKEKIESLQKSIAAAKSTYAKSLKALETISEEIHRKRGDYLPPLDEIPVGPREPGVGAEREPECTETAPQPEVQGPRESPKPEKSDSDDESSLQVLRMKVRELALKPIDGKIMEEAWASELNETINKLDQLLMLKESKTAVTGPNIKVDEHLPHSEQKRRDSLPLMNRNISKSNPDVSKSMMSLDVAALERDASTLEQESYLKAIIEDKSPTGTYTESASERNESPDDILLVECDNSGENQEPIIRMTKSTDA